MPMGERGDAERAAGSGSTFPRVPALDGVRGLASLAVVVHHSILALPEAVHRTVDRWLDWVPARALLVGRPAVIVFFVLSGAVLTMSLAGRPTTFAAFATRRVFRIYLPLVASLAISFVICLALTPHPLAGYSHWFNGVWGVKVTVGILFGHLLMLGRAEDATLNNVVWSLVYEMRLSLLIPLLFVASRRVGLARVVVATAALAIAVEYLIRRAGLTTEPVFGSGWVDSVLFTAHFLPFFVAGMVLVLENRRIAAGVACLPRAAVWAAWLLVAFALCRESDFSYGVGAVLLVGLAMTPGAAARALARPPIEWLGRVSYSLYLVHLPILVALVRLLHDRLAPGWILALGVPLALGAAEVMYRLVEAPAIAWGRRVVEATRPVGCPERGRPAGTGA